MTLPSLETDRLRLRPFRRDDRDAVFELFSDPQVTRYWSFPAWTDLAQADGFLEPLLAAPSAEPSALPFAVAERDSDVLVGTTTIWEWRHDQQRAEIGYSLRSAYWRRGLAREAVSRALVYGFDELGLRRVEADVDPRNAPSLALLESLGFTREGLLRERWNVAGELQDAVILGLLARELRRR